MSGGFKMDKKMRIVLAIVIVIIVTMETMVMPATFLSNTNPEEVTKIVAFDGTNGTGFEITDTEDIEYIVNNVKSIQLKRTGISLGYKGYYMRLRFEDRTGKEIQTFIINSEKNIRQDPFFYEIKTAEGEEPANVLCLEYILALEEKLK